MGAGIRRVNKRAEDIDDSTKTLIQIFFFILLFFIGWKAYNLLNEFFINDMEQGTIKSMERLQVELDNFIEDERHFPLYIDASHKIMVLPPQDSLLCKGNNSCVCICMLDSECENNAMKKCRTLRESITHSIVIPPHFDEEDNPITFTCTLKKNKTIDITC